MKELPIPSLTSHVDYLKGSIVLITGGASGFGQGVAISAGKYGAKAVVSDIQEAGIAKVIAEIRGAGGEASTPSTRTDVTKITSQQAAFKHCIEVYGRPPDIVFANAGVAMDDWFEEDGEVAATSKSPAHPRATRDKTLVVNLKGAIDTCEIAQKLWKEHPAQAGEARKRRLIVTASLGGMSGIPLASIYSVGKHAILGYWKATCDKLKVEGDKAGFECFAVCPFFAKTTIFDIAVLTFLAGIPLTPVQLCVDTMIYAASRPSDNKSTGNVLLIPDDAAPLSGEVDEYDPLDEDWGVKMSSRDDKHRAWLKENHWIRFLRDVSRNMVGTSPGAFAFRLLSILGVLGAIIATVSLYVPAYMAIIAGLLLGVARTKLFQKAQRAGESRRA